MNLQSTESIIIREMDFKESDKLVTFLTKDQGKKSGIVRGTKKINSKTLGLVEPFTHAHVFFVEKPHSELVQIRKFDAIENFYAIRQQYDRILYATYFTEIIYLCDIDTEESEHFFQLLLKNLHSLQEYQNFSELKVLFEKNVFQLLGILPNLETCCHCQRALWKPTSPNLPQLQHLGQYQLDCPEGTIRCPDCHSQGTAIVPISAGTLSYWKALEPIASYINIRIKATQQNLQELDHAFITHFHYHIGKTPKSHALLKTQIPKFKKTKS